MTVWFLAAATPTHVQSIRASTQRGSCRNTTKIVPSALVYYYYYYYFWEKVTEILLRLTREKECATHAYIEYPKSFNKIP